MAESPKCAMAAAARCIALIVAAGHGVRAGEGPPKQYRRIAGSPVLRRTALAFASHPDVSAVQAVISPEHRALYDEATDGLGLRPPVTGGETRQASVLHGLESIADDRPQFVLIHDAARPLVSA